MAGTQRGADAPHFVSGVVPFGPALNGLFERLILCLDHCRLVGLVSLHTKVALYAVPM